MQDGYFGDQAVQIPNFFPAPGEALQGYIQNQQRNREWQYRLQKDKEGDDWRKLNLIQELTDLSKYQTGSDIADAIGNRQASTILQKYTAAAKTMSPMELQAKIAQEMSGITIGMSSLKDELVRSDKQLMEKKQEFPFLDYGTLAKESRADILHRRLENENSFVNPLQVAPSTFDLSNPEFLSKYVVKNDLSEEFINPKGKDKSTVFVGTPYQNTKFEADIPYFKKPNFSQDQLKNGFLKSKENPRLSLKSSILPSESLPASKGKPFEVIDADVMSRPMENTATAIKMIAATRQVYPDFDKFNAKEKEYALRNVFATKAREFDQSDFHPTAQTHNPSYIFNMGKEAKNPGADWVKEAVKAVKSGDQDLVSNRFSLLFGGNTRDKFKAAEIKDGKLHIRFDHVYTDPMTGLDITANPEKYVDLDLSDPYLSEKLTGEYQRFTGSDAKAEDVPRYKEREPLPKEKTYHYNGKTFTEKQIADAAKASGMTSEEYKKQLRLK